jgi:hypothetical protein
VAAAQLFAHELARLLGGGAVALQMGAEDEEDGLDAVLIKRVEDLGRLVDRRPVVEGEQDLGAGFADSANAADANVAVASKNAPMNEAPRTKLEAITQPPCGKLLMA